jgi:hypothetical protein
MQYYHGSPISFVKDLLENHEWIVWKFVQVPKGFWTKQEKLKVMEYPDFHLVELMSMFLILL